MEHLRGLIVPSDKEVVLSREGNELCCQRVLSHQFHRRHLLIYRHRNLHPKVRRMYQTRQSHVLGRRICHRSRPSPSQIHLTLQIYRSQQRLLTSRCQSR